VRYDGCDGDAVCVDVGRGQSHPPVRASVRPPSRRDREVGNIQGTVHVPYERRGFVWTRRNTARGVRAACAACALPTPRRLQRGTDRGATLRVGQGVAAALPRRRLARPHEAPNGASSSLLTSPTGFSDLSDRCDRYVPALIARTVPRHMRLSVSPRNTTRRGGDSRDGDPPRRRGGSATAVCVEDGPTRGCYAGGGSVCSGWGEGHLRRLC
jgi:hypothetical protein